MPPCFRHAAVLLLLIWGGGVAAQQAAPDQPIILPDGLPLQMPEAPRPPDGPPVPAPAPGEAGRGESVILVPSPVVTVDWEVLYERSAWGRRVDRETDAEIAILSEDNRRLAEELTVEESALTEQRGTMSHGAFRALADAFDARVTEIRRAQDARSRAIVDAAEAEREAFFESVVPLLDDILYRRGAVAVLDRRAVIRAAREIDVTADLLEIVDARLGEGGAPPPAPPEAEAPQAGEGAAETGAPDPAPPPGAVPRPDDGSTEAPATGAD